MLDKTQAIAFFKTIPAIAAVYTDTHDPFVDQLLEVTKGETPDGATFYRVWITAYRYLQQSPALWRIKRHDRTELGSYQNPLEFLKEQQASEDLANELKIPSGQEAIAPSAQTVSIRVGTEFI